MRDLPQPHDRFFRAVFSHTANVRDLLLNALPDPLTRMLDLSSLELSEESFVDHAFASHHSDILIRTRARGSALFIYVLVEHKSSPYRWTLLQLLRYMVQIWEKHRSQHKRARTLPPIIPLILYHGSRTWRLPLAFSSYVQPAAGLEAHIPSFKPLLFNLQELEDTKLRGSVTYLTALKAFKYALSGLRTHLGEILRTVSALPMDKEQRAFVSMLFEYILQAGRDVTHTDIERELETMGTQKTRNAYRTVAEELIAKGKTEGRLEGKLEGRREGEIEGKRNILLRLLEKKFGRLSASAAGRVRGSRDPEPLDRAIDLVLEARSIEEALQPLE